MMEQGKKNKNNNKTIVVFYHRIIIFSLFILAFLIFSISFFYRTFSADPKKYVSYEEKSDIDYKVFLKKNNFYDSPYLEKNMVYVASLINTIDVYFNYYFSIDEKSTIAFDYDVVGTLSITDREGKNTFYEKDYKLLNNTTETITKGNKFAISRRITIDYDYYNYLANKFKTDYGIESASNLKVTLKVHQKGNKDNSFDLDNSSNMSIVIPLSERSINIKLNYKEFDKKDKLIKQKLSSGKSYVFLIAALVFSALTIISTIILIRGLITIKNKKSNYDRFIEKTLREYDRLIVETTSPPFIDKKNVVEISKFNELLDVRDNLNLPIKYYVVYKHELCYFYIDHEEEIYVLVVNAREL